MSKFKSFFERTYLKSKKRNIEPGNTALLLIDIQEKLVKVIPNDKTLIFNLKKLVDACSLLGVSIYITEQNPEKLGSTIASIVPKVKYKSYTKSCFSCINCKNLIKDLRRNKIENILLCGLESHICVLQSSIDLIENNFNIYIISDGIKSRSNFDHEVSIKRLRDSGAIISSTETAIFEICKTSENEHFKSISQIIKRTDSNF